MGGKDVWGLNEDAKGTNLAALEALGHMDRSYIVYAGAHCISMDRLSRTTAAEGVLFRQ